MLDILPPQQGEFSRRTASASSTSTAGGFRRRDACGRTPRVAAEALGTGLLVATVVGSGIMAEKLAGGNVAIALLGNTIPTGAILVVLILALGPISGAHFNPAVSLVMAINGGLRWRELGPYAVAQILGGCSGTLVAHGMFDLPLLQLASKVRNGSGAVVCRVRRDLRAAGDDPGRRPLSHRGGSVCGRAVHNRRVLVHRLDLVRQPSGDDRALHNGHLRRDRAEATRRCSWVLRSLARSRVCS